MGRARSEPRATAQLNNRSSRRSGRPSIMLDVDSTMYPLLTAMGSLPGGERVSYTADYDWDSLPDLCGGIDPMVELFHEAMSFEVSKNFPAFPGAAGALSQIHAVADIHVVTDRNGTLAGDTEQWLTANAIPFDSLLCDRKLDKLARGEELGVSLFIDDHPQLLAAAHQANIAILALRWPHNQAVLSSTGLPYATSWAQLGPMALQKLTAVPAAA